MSGSAPGSNISEIALEETFQSRPVNTQIFKPFLISRLMEHPATVDNALEYQVHFQNVGVPGTRSAAVRWTWTDDMIPPAPLAAQQEFVTETAAYGLAFAIIQRLTSAELLDSAVRKNRFDYVLIEGGERCGLEVSGTLADDRKIFRDRHRQKIRQLLENPLRWSGYVVVVGFARREVIVSYHAGEGRVRR